MSRAAVMTVLDREPGATGPSFVRLLDADPDLGSRLSRRETSAATSRSMVGTITLAPTPWINPGPLDSDLSLFVLSGTMARQVRFSDRASTELLGPGQLLRPGLSSGADTVVSDVVWRVLTPTWAGVLDKRFWARMSDFPDVVIALLDRALWRSRALGISLAIARIPNLETRVLSLLWHLADSHGRVTELGVAVELPLSHETLADLVSASRPSVSRAVKQLERTGQISRPVGRRGFLLHEMPSSSISGSISGAATSSAFTFQQLLEHAGALVTALPLG